MSKNINLLDTSWRSARTLVNGVRPAVEASQNWMGGVAFGSFSYLGRDMSEYPLPRDPRLYLAVEVGERCQLQCRHCIYDREEPTTRDPSPLVERKLSDAFSRGFDPLWVSFAGKEPTLYPDQLLRLAAMVRRSGRTNILMTNGLKLRGRFLDRLAEVIDYFDISLDGDEDAHDWMRGNGMFARTWNSIETVLNRTESNVGLIATLVHARLPSGRPQHEDLAALARRLHDSFGGNPRIMLSISLYYGPPEDPLLLDAEDITALIKQLIDIDFPARILLTANYAHLWTDICDTMGWGNTSLSYDAPTGFAMIQRGNVSCVLFNLSAGGQIGLRVSNEGRVFLSCNHLTLGDRGAELHIAELNSCELDQITRHVMAGKHRYSNDLDLAPSDCLNCDRWNQCLGGDRLSGLYFDGRPADPYCGLITRNKT